jgi:hypothetical protein
MTIESSVVTAPKAWRASVERAMASASSPASIRNSQPKISA